MVRKSKLHCFRCGTLIEKGQSCRNRYDKYPICKDCLIEDIYNDFDFGEEYAFDEVMKKFKGNYNKYWKWLEETHLICDQCNTWTPKDNFIDDMNMCQGCVEYIEDKNKEKNKVGST